MEKKTKISHISLPDFKVDEADIPTIRVKSIRFEKFKAFENYYLDLSDRSFACFVGINGCGKSTILDAIQLIFSRFDEYKEDRVKNLLGKLVRHVDGKDDGVYGDGNFLITADIESSCGNYQIQIDKNGFIKDHPEEIKWIIYRLCFYARFDQELHQFQLPRDKWNTFKELFNSVTGFEIEEQTTLFDQSEDPVQADILSKYVLGFLVHKPHETITHRECSNGEKKIIKCFSTLLTKEYIPKILLIDDIAMHVELGRHVELVNCMRSCFPDSQIFATTHSYYLSRNFGKKNELYDLRLLQSPEIVQKETWRLYVNDEIKDCISKLNSIVDNGQAGELIDTGVDLMSRCFDENEDGKGLVRDSENFINKSVHLFLEELVTN